MAKFVHWVRKWLNLNHQKRRRVLVLHPSETVGGAETLWKNLICNGEIESTLDVFYFTYREIQERLFGKRKKNIVTLDKKEVSSWFSDPDSVLKESRMIASYLKAYKPDIAIGVMHYASTLLCLAKRELKIPVHPIVVSSPRGPSYHYLRHFENEEMDRVRQLRGYFNILCAQADFVLVASEGMRWECVDMWGARPERCVVIPNGVDVKFIRRHIRVRKSNRIEMGKEIILSACGRLSLEKRFDLIIMALSLLKNHFDIRLKLIGDGPELNSLKELSWELGVRDRVDFLGFKSLPFVDIATSHLFIHTCLFEGFGNVIVEAMACGVPVISVDCPYGPREILDNGRYGVLCKDDPKSLAIAIEGLISNPALRQRLSREGVRRVTQNYSLGKIVKQYRRFLTSLLENGRYEKFSS